MIVNKSGVYNSHKCESIFLRNPTKVEKYITNIRKTLDIISRMCYTKITVEDSRKLKREVNRRRKLKAGLKLKQKGGENMKIEITTCNAITCEELKDFMKFLNFAEKRYPSLEVSLKAEVLEKSVDDALKPKEV